MGVSIARSAADVYSFVRDPASLPTWAAGLGAGVEERDGRWFAAGPLGEVEVRFAPENAFGVLDHDVTLPDGTTVLNPMRVVPDGEGCEVVFTVRRAAGTTDAAFEADAAAVRTDLATLRRVLQD